MDGLAVTFWLNEALHIDLRGCLFILEIMSIQVIWTDGESYT